MSYDAVLIPGGGLDAAGEPAPWVLPRLDAAVARAGNGLLVALSAGTPYKPPPLDERGHPVFESVASARYLIRRGIAPERILTDSWSLDTIGNAFFARLMHCEPRRLARLLVVTSEFHLARARAVFEWVFRLPPLAVPFALDYFAVANMGLTASTLAARLEKERAGLAQLQAIIARVGSLAGLHAFLFGEHEAYRAGAKQEGAPATEPWIGSY